MQFRKSSSFAAVASLIFVCGLSFNVAAQSVKTTPTPATVEKDLEFKPRPTQRLNPSGGIGDGAVVPTPPANLPPISREQRQQAYAKLLEGQRYLWTLQGSRRGEGSGVTARLARAALQKAVELNPGLAEGYTALAEVVGINGGTTVEVERLAGIAVKLDRDNFGAHRLLARIYTSQSRLNTGNLEKIAAEKAVNEWREIGRLDPRNAEAWAFLSIFYELTNQNEKAVDALQKWSASAISVEEGFYRSITRGESLSPSSASVRLGSLLLRADKISEAITALSRAVANDPNDAESLGVLNQAIESASPAEAAQAVEILRAAVYAAPNNFALLEVLIAAQSRAGQSADAVKLLRDASSRISGEDKSAAANLLVRLASLYAETMRETEAIATYEEALRSLDINNSPLRGELESEFAARVVPRLIAVYRQTGQTAKARETIARLRNLLGETDPTADIQLVEFQRATGEREAALRTAREARKRFANNETLAQLETNLLTETGKVDEAVAVLRAKIVNKSKEIAVPQAVINDFLTHLQISNLYTQANRGADAVLAAQQARDLAQDDRMTSVALLTMATAQNTAGDFKAAESSLREVIKKEPNNATALNNLGYFMVERGERIAEAVELIKKAVEREPTNSSFLDSLGWAHFKLNQLTEAEKYLTEAARRDADSATIQDHLGDLYERQGKSELARTTWRKALNLSTDATEIAKIKVKLGEKKKP